MLVVHVDLLHTAVVHGILIHGAVEGTDVVLIGVSQGELTARDIDIVHFSRSF